jgi:hypothetical protein
MFFKFSRYLSQNQIKESAKQRSCAQTYADKVLHFQENELDSVPANSPKSSQRTDLQVDMARNYLYLIFSLRGWAS